MCELETEEIDRIVDENSVTPSFKGIPGLWKTTPATPSKVRTVPKREKKSLCLFNYVYNMIDF